MAEAVVRYEPREKRRSVGEELALQLVPQLLGGLMRAGETAMTYGLQRELSTKGERDWTRRKTTESTLDRQKGLGELLRNLGGQQRFTQEPLPGAVTEPEPSEPQATVAPLVTKPPVWQTPKSQVPPTAAAEPVVRTPQLPVTPRPQLPMRGVAGQGTGEPPMPKPAAAPTPAPVPATQQPPMPKKASVAVSGSQYMAPEFAGILEDAGKTVPEMGETMRAVSGSVRRAADASDAYAQRRTGIDAEMAQFRLPSEGEMTELEAEYFNTPGKGGKLPDESDPFERIKAIDWSLRTIRQRYPDIDRATANAFATEAAARAAKQEAERAAELSKAIGNAGLGGPYSHMVRTAQQASSAAFRMALEFQKKEPKGSGASVKALQDLLQTAALNLEDAVKRGDEQAIKAHTVYGNQIVERLRAATGMDVPEVGAWRETFTTRGKRAGETRSVVGELLEKVRASLRPEGREPKSTQKSVLEAEYKTLAASLGRNDVSPSQKVANQQRMAEIAPLIGVDPTVVPSLPAGRSAED